MALLAGAGLVVTSLPASATLSGVASSTHDVHHFPDWYQDDAGVKLELCVVDDLCLGGNNLPDPAAPMELATATPEGQVTDPGNFPGEAFYAHASAEVALAGGGTASAFGALEAAFATEDPIDGDQIIFARVQVDVRNAAPGRTLRFVTPWGPTITGTTNVDGRLRVRRESTTSPVTDTRSGFGPSFVRWDAGAPAGFIGNPGVLHTVTGGRNGINSLTVLDVATDGSTRLAGPEQFRFEVAGKTVGTAPPAPAATPPGAPGMGVASPGVRSATVRWTAPTSSGTSAITGYTVVSSPGNVVVAAPADATSAVVSGLTAGTSYTFTVQAKNNTGGDGAFSAASNAVVPTAPATARSLRMGDRSALEGTGTGTKTFNFPVTLSAASPTAVTVTYRTVAGAATSPSDFTAKTGTLTIPAGATTRNATVQVVRDRRREANERFTVEITGVTGGATVADGVGLGTIRNDD